MEQPAKPVNIHIGCMTGTSVDGLDLAAICVDADIQILAHTEASIPSELRQILLDLGQPDKNDKLHTIALADAELGTYIGQAINQFIEDFQLPRQDVVAIGSHGQTIRHQPGTYTVQIGDPNRIAETTGITTVADFRRRDVAAGGQGAPLVPPFHQALFGHISGAAVLNIGGISNVTLLGDPPKGFDTGPGNGLMDSWFNHHHQDNPHAFDADGQWAKQGKVDPQLLQNCLTDPFFQSPPPKSTGREYFNLEWLHSLLGNQNPNDVQTTLCELTARCTLDAIHTWAGEVDQLIVCGGGRHNGFLMERLSQAGNLNATSCETHGYDGDSLEAAAFAWLAAQTLKGNAGNEPMVTGADGYRVLGGIYPG